MALSKSVAKEQPFEVRGSRVHGSGGFALRRIKKGTRIAEYLGERITPSSKPGNFFSPKASLKL